MKALPDGWPRISASLFYDDARAAIDWLCKAFGFELRLLVESGDGKVAHSELVYGDGVVMIAQASQELRWLSPRQAGGTTQGLMVYVDDVDAHCATSRAAGATITTELKNSDYGEEYWSDRTYGARDCGGHNWWFTQRLKTGDAQWSKMRSKVDKSDHEKR